MEENGSRLSVVSRKVYFCKFCGEFARQPVLNVICSHLFCWCCLYRNVMRKRRKGRRQCCPLCKSHIAISGLNITIIRVCGGPQRGAVSCLDDDYENMRKAKVIEKKLKIKGVPRRPWFEDASRYPSLSDFVCSLLVRCCALTMQICKVLEMLCMDNELISIEHIEVVQKSICDLIEVVKEGGLWFKGKEGNETRKSICVMENTIVHKRNGTVKTGKKTRLKGKVQLIKRPGKLQLSSQFFLRQKQERRACSKKEQDLEPIDEQPAHLKSFSCTICGRPAYEPVVSKSGHLFCWTCLNSRGEFPTVGCPITNLPESIVLSHISVSPIYHGVEYEMEDALLIANRRIDEQKNDEITQIHSRFNPKLASEFIDYMISRVNEEGAEIIEFLDEVVSDMHGHQEEREDIYRQIMGRVNALFEWLVTAWCQKCREREIDEKYGPKVLTNNIEKDAYYEMAWKKLAAKEGQMSYLPGGNRVGQQG